MDNQNNIKKEPRVSVLGAGMALGLLFGGLFGLVVDNMIIFAGGGMILGLAVGTAIESRQS